MKKTSKFLCLLLTVIIALFAAGCSTEPEDYNSHINSVLSDLQSNLEDELSSFTENTQYSSVDETDPSSSDITDINSGSDSTDSNNSELTIDENGSYTTKEDVALYIRIYGKLPKNFITKKQAEALGWTGGSLDLYAIGKCIGGDYFGNYEGLLPSKDGRKYTECDIDTLGASSRGAKRIVFSNDGLIYYTEDHYESFTLLYGEE